MTSFPDLHTLAENASTNYEEMEHITNMINDVYAKAEKGLWRDNQIRTTSDDLQAHTYNGQIVVARNGGQTVGCVRVHRLDPETGGFGLLAVDSSHQGNGTGRQLIHFAENLCRREQLPTMQIELLIPQEGPRPDKESMKNWYIRLGYEPVRTENVEDLLPTVAEMLAVPCRFIVFHKKL